MRFPPRTQQGSMASEKSIIYFGAGSGGLPATVVSFAGEQGLRVIREEDPSGVISLLNRSYPAALIMDAVRRPTESIALCRELKKDAFTAIVPLVVMAPAADSQVAPDALEAGADEVLTDEVSDREQVLRLDLALRRADRDVSVHPTTRLPGTAQIERDLGERIGSDEPFAICYADLDHFKEFNDRYGYNNGDKVILLLSRILRDLVRGLAPGGFVGHIGGDDFIFNVPIDFIESCCDEIIRLFDELIPFQYTKEDTRAGYFLGKDRRGNIHRVPIMTLSIGVVTSSDGRFTHTAQIGELATEMKSYAKTLPGSLYVVDRRSMPVQAPEGATTGPLSDGAPSNLRGVE